jgi:peptide-methionine (S)-S-oxide reductase
MDTIRRKAFTIAAMLAMATTLAAAGKTPDPIVDSPLTTVKGEQTVVLAGGCFWGLQAVFEHVKGVNAVAAGNDLPKVTRLRQQFPALYVP